MQDVPHHDDVDVGQRIGKEASGLELHARRETVVFDILFEDGRDFRQIESGAREMWDS